MDLRQSAPAKSSPVSGFINSQIGLVPGGIPGFAYAKVHLERNAEFDNIAHLLGDQRFQLFELAREHLEDQFVVNLKQHALLRPSSVILLAMRVIASFMMSAAVP